MFVRLASSSSTLTIFTESGKMIATPWSKQILKLSRPHEKASYSVSSLCVGQTQQLVRFFSSSSGSCKSHNALRPHHADGSSLRSWFGKSKNNCQDWFRARGPSLRNNSQPSDGRRGLNGRSIRRVSRISSKIRTSTTVVRVSLSLARASGQKCCN